MRLLIRFTRWFWSGALPSRQWRYFFGGARESEHARLRAYRLRFAPFALSQAMLGLPWAGAAMLVPSAKALLLCLGALKIVLGGALSGALIHFFFPIRADESELRGRTFIGLARRAQWEDIEAVTARRWLFTEFALVQSKGENTTMWLPLFLAEQPAFQNELRAWLAPEHPMRQFFERRDAKASGPSGEASCPTS